MLPRDHRLTHPADFSTAVRGGTRASSRHVVLHARWSNEVAGALGDPGGTPRVGFIVSKAVGDAVTRNRVKRRLRHLMAERMDRLPPEALVVVRALPVSSGANSAELGLGLDRCLARVLP